MNKIKVLYCRVSSIDQRTDRQRINEKDFNIVVEDKCSGSVPFFERDGGKEIQNYLEKGILQELSVWQIDRLGRNLRDILNTIDYFNERSIPIKFISQGLVTLDASGKENPVAKMIISILGVVGEMEKAQIKERQLEGIRLAKARGVYTGRKTGSSEDVLQFLEKPKNKKAFELLKKGYKATEVAKIVGVHINTLTKIKKVTMYSTNCKSV